MEGIGDKSRQQVVAEKVVSTAEMGKKKERTVVATGVAGIIVVSIGETTLNFLIT